MRTRDPELSAIISVCTALGAFGYLIVSHLLAGGGQLTAVVVGFTVSALWFKTADHLKKPEDSD